MYSFYDYLNLLDEHTQITQFLTTLFIKSWIGSAFLRILQNRSFAMPSS